MNDNIKMINRKMLMPHPDNPRKDLGDLKELVPRQLEVGKGNQGSSDFGVLLHHGRKAGAVLLVPGLLWHLIVLHEEDDFGPNPKG